MSNLKGREKVGTVKRSVMLQSSLHIAMSGKDVADCEETSVWERASGKEDVKDFY